MLTVRGQFLDHSIVKRKQKEAGRQAMKKKLSSGRKIPALFSQYSGIYYDGLNLKGVLKLGKNLTRSQTNRPEKGSNCFRQKAWTGVPFQSTFFVMPAAVTGKARTGFATLPPAAPGIPGACCG